MKGIYKLLFVMLLMAGVALAQTSPSTSTPDQSQAPSAAPDASQAPAATPDQSQTPPAAGSQSQYPSSSGQSAAGAASSSSDVKTAIQTAFQQDPSLMNSGINVSVSDSKVTLSGSASSADKEKAHKIAEANAGGRTVVDKVTTSDSSGAAPKQ